LSLNQGNLFLYIAYAPVPFGKFNAISNHEPDHQGGCENGSVNQAASLIISTACLCFG
jgi:hypothetical protein